MNKEQMDALFAMLAAFPGMSWNIGADNVMRIEVWLRDDQVKFMSEAHQLMAPASDEEKPKWTDLFGMDPDFTGGKPIDEFLDEERGEA